MLRKGQKLFNGIAKRDLITIKVDLPNGTSQIYPYVNLHHILFYMSDQEFDRIMNEVIKND